MRKLREGEVRKQNDKGNDEGRQWKDEDGRERSKLGVEIGEGGGSKKP